MRNWLSILVLVTTACIASDTRISGTQSYAVTSPAQISADQNNYTIGDYTIFRINSDATRQITGIANTKSGRKIKFINVGAQVIQFPHEAGGSTAKYRILTPSGTTVVLSQYDSLEMMYDSTLQRWMVTSIVTNSSPIGGSGTINTVSKFVTATEIGDSHIIDTGTQIQMPSAPITADATADSIFTASADDKTPLVLQAKSATQSAPLLELQASTGAVGISGTAVGELALGNSAVIRGGGNDYAFFGPNQIGVNSAGVFTFGSGVTSYLSADLGLARAAAGVLAGTDGTNTEWKIGEGAAAFSVTNTAGVDVTLRARDGNGGGGVSGGNINIIPGARSGAPGVHGSVNLCDTGGNAKLIIDGGGSTSTFYNMVKSTAGNFWIDSDSYQFRIGDNGDGGIGRADAGVLIVTNGTTSNALRLNASGRIYGNAVAAIAANAGNKRAVTTNVATMTSYIAHNLCAGQTVTIASCGDATYNGTYIIASVPSTTTFTFALTHADEGETADAAVTMTASAQVQLGGAPTTPDATADTIFTASAANKTPVVIQGVAGQSANLLEFQTSAGVATAWQSAVMGFIATELRVKDGYANLSAAGLVLYPTGMPIKWGINMYGTNADLSLNRAAAGVLGGGDGTNTEWKIGEGAAAFSVTNTAGVDVTLRARDANGGDRDGGSLILTPGTNTGTGVIGRVRVTLANCPAYANNAAALAGGLVAGDLYRTGADPDPVCIVH